MNISYIEHLGVNIPYRHGSVILEFVVFLKIKKKHCQLIEDYFEFRPDLI